jgi:mono/diheme cytochrome c family protein
MQTRVHRGIAVILMLCAVACSPKNRVSAAEEGPNSPQLAQGKQLFTTHCANCHALAADMTGPALRGADQRWPNRSLLYAFVRNSRAVIDTNAYAKQLFMAYNQTPMPPMPQLTDGDIERILRYANAKHPNQ